MDRTIRFRLPDGKSAELALATLNELGYKAHRGGGPAMPEIHLEVDHSELTSALEVMQACGGTLLESEDRPALEAFERAYGLEAVPIPAHIVVDEEPVEADCDLNLR
jgi:hypothetical protein